MNTDYVTYSDSQKINYYSNRVNDMSLTKKQRGYAKYRISVLKNKSKKNKTIDILFKKDLTNNFKKNNKEMKKLRNKVSYDDIHQFNKKRKQYKKQKLKMINDYLKQNYVFDSELIYNEDNFEKPKYLANNEDVYQLLDDFLKHNKQYQKIVYNELFFENKMNRFDDHTAKEKAVNRLKHELGVMNIKDMSLENVFKILKNKG